MANRPETKQTSNNLTKMKNITILLLAILLTSCGARKVNKSTTETKTETAIFETVKTDNVSETKKETVNDVVTDDFEVEPIDTAKPIEVIAPNGSKTTFKNARFKRKTITDKTKHVETAKASKTEQKSINTTISKQEKATVKNVDRKQFSISEMLLDLWWLWLLLILAYFGYRAYRKYTI